MTMPLPEPDTHCWDDDTSKDVWSHSPDQMRAYGEACAAAERERCTHSELAEQCAVYARRIMELEKALGECSGALEHAGHPIEWQAKIDAAVAAERERAAEIADAHSQHNYSWASENADMYRAQAHWAARIAKAIRAQGETP